MRSQTTFFSGWITVAAAFGAFFAQVEPKDSPNPAVIREFEKRVHEYRDLRRSIEQKLGGKFKSTESSGAISDHQKQIAADIREARRGAAQGAIFTPEIALEFRRLIGLTMKGADGARIRETLKNAEPVNVKLAVNLEYPSTLPLQTTPGTLLQNLPKLPEELEYRIVGRSLVLRCVKGNMIVDFIPDIIA
jgi:hypothetical protein